MASGGGVGGGVGGGGGGGQNLKRSIDSDGSGNYSIQQLSTAFLLNTINENPIQIPEPECKKSNSGYQSPNPNLQAVSCFWFCDSFHAPIRIWSVT